MIRQKTRTLLKDNWIFYLTGAALVLGLKYFYSQADADELKWILTPTSRWVSILSGLSFEYMPHTGFVNHDIRFIIASSCSGVQFMLIAIATLIFSFVHRISSGRGRGRLLKGACWSAFSIISSYLFTIFVNGLRIVLSIYLPDTLVKLGFAYEKWLSPRTLHTLIGTVTYFSFLLVLYRLADLLTDRDLQTHSTPKRPYLSLLARCIPPLFWYFSIVLGIPFLNRAWQRDYKKFADYAVLVTGVCLLIFLMCCLVLVTRTRRKELS